MDIASLSVTSHSLGEEVNPTNTINTAAYVAVAPSVWSLLVLKVTEQSSANNTTATVVVTRFFVEFWLIAMTYIGTRMNSAPVMATVNRANRSTFGLKLFGA